jgi:hypothetical protein
VLGGREFFFFKFFFFLQTGINREIWTRLGATHTLTRRELAWQRIFLLFHVSSSFFLLCELSFSLVLSRLLDTFPSSSSSSSSSFLFPFFLFGCTTFPVFFRGGILFCVIFAWRLKIFLSSRPRWQRSYVCGMQVCLCVLFPSSCVFLFACSNGKLTMMLLDIQWTKSC